MVLCTEDEKMKKIQCLMLKILCSQKTDIKLICSMKYAQGALGV